MKKRLIIILMSGIVSLSGISCRTQERGKWRPLPRAKRAETTACRAMRQKVLGPSARLGAAFDSPAGSFASSGSAVAVSRVKSKSGWKVRLLTAAHVVTEPGGAKLTGLSVEFFQDGELSDKAPGRVVSVDSSRDLALVEAVFEKPVPTAALATGEAFDHVRVLREVYTVGCKLGMKPSPSQGLVSARILESGGTCSLWTTTAATIFGNSGGGVFLKDTGELIGIVVMVGMVRAELVPRPGCPSVKGSALFPVSHMGFFVPLDEIRCFMETAEGR